jgi:hypothetical protein
VESPHPLFVAFIKAAKGEQERRNHEKEHHLFEQSVAEG